MNLDDKLEIGKEVSPIVPTPTLGTHSVNKDFIEQWIDGKDIHLRSPNTDSTIYFYDDEETEDLYSFVRYNADNNFLEFGSKDGPGEPEVVSARIDRGKQDWEFQDIIQVLRPGRGVVFADPTFDSVVKNPPIPDGNSNTGRYELRMNTGGVLEVWSIDNANALITKIWGSDTGGSTPKPPVDETYADVAALLADQNNQEQDYFYEVTDASGLTAISSGAAVLLYNASTPTGTESDYLIIWGDVSVTQEREYKLITDSNYTLVNSDKDKYLIFSGANTVVTVLSDDFNDNDVIKGVNYSQSSILQIKQVDPTTNPDSLVFYKPETADESLKVVSNGSFSIKVFGSSGILSGDLVKEYEITASPDGTLWKTGQVDNSGNPVAPTAL